MPSSFAGWWRKNSAATRDLEVVGTAANGRIALAKMTQVNPDVVILDVEMPEMDGLATLKELRKTYPRLPVIMFSSLTERGAEATLDALALGAIGLFHQASERRGGRTPRLAVIREQLIPQIKALCAHAQRGANDAGRKALGARSQPVSAIPSPVVTRPNRARCASWPSEPPPAGRMRLPNSFTSCRPTFPCRS